ncbi:MAG: DeoR/GlpR transcriptional regulator [Kiritimatiellae bacterium]|nr:DeoR/GlpR transcriptional regulator [Kiritimatiellia bacterium]
MTKVPDNGVPSTINHQPSTMNHSAGMFAEERRIRILERLKREQKITVVELCDAFGVSSATIRTDLRELQRRGLLVRTHGGAIEKTKTGFELDSENKRVRHLAEKQRIAEAALDLVEDGDTLLVDTGTTTLELAKRLSARRDLTIVTNDIEIARILEEIESAKILFMGGMLRRRFHCTVGLQGRDMLAGVMVDKAFMGANSVSVRDGAGTPDISQAETKKSMIAISNKVVILCDHSKIGQVSFARFATLEQIDTIVTDRIERPDKDLFEESGVEVIVAP